MGRLVPPPLPQYPPPLQPQVIKEGCMGWQRDPFCSRCSDTGTVGFWKWKKVCPKCNGNPKSLMPPRPKWIPRPENPSRNPEVVELDPNPSKLFPKRYIEI